MPPSLYEFYNENWVEFGRILTDMEKEGMLVDREHLRKAQVWMVWQMVCERGVPYFPTCSHMHSEALSCWT